MPYSRDLLAACRAYEVLPLDERRSAEGLTTLAGLYAAITGQAVGSCRQCQYSDFRAALTAYIREATRFFFPELMADSKYTFAAKYTGETISDGRYNKNVTAENLTDDDAKQLLKLGYGHVIVEKGQAPAEASGESSAGATTGTTGTGGATNVLEVSSDKPLVPQADLEKEQKAHAATKEKGANALKAEKEAHKGTHKELSDTKKLLAESEKQLAQVREQLAKATDAAQGDEKPETGDAK